MELSLLQEMKKNIDRYMSEGFFRDKEIILFGSNESSEKMMVHLRMHQLEVTAIVDNNQKKVGTKLYGVPVYLPEDYLVSKHEECVILIASRYYPEMVSQLETMGYQENKNILKVADYSRQHAHTLSESEFEERLQIVRRGEQIYNDICEKYEIVEKIFVCPPAELGATYVGISFIREYLRKHRLGKCVIVTRNRACAKVAYLFGYEDNVYTVERDGMDDFLQYAVFMNYLDGKILVMNFRHPYTCRLGEIGNYKGIHFVDQFRYGIFKLGKNAKPEIPHIHRNDEIAQEYVKNLFEREQLQYGKTVILLPYANTAPLIPNDFWERIAQRWQNDGYIVCTNSSGDTEQPVKGTKPLFFDIRYALEVTEAAGTFIGLRSGLCDVLSTSKAKKIIIYPDRIYGMGSFMEFYHLVNNGLSEEAEEIVWDENMEV